MRCWQEGAVSVYINADIEAYELYLEIIYRKDRSCDKVYLRVYRIWLKMFQRGTKNQAVTLHTVFEVPGQEDGYIVSLMPYKNSKLFADMSCDDMMDSIHVRVFLIARIKAF